MNRKAKPPAASTVKRLVRSLLLRAADQVGEGLMILDKAGVVCYANAALEETLGVPGGEILGRHPSELAPESDGENLFSVLLGLLSEDGAQRKEAAHSRPDGETLHLDLSLTPGEEKGGQLTGFVVTVKDVTRRVVIEERLRASEERYALSVAGAKDGLWDLDLRTNKVYLSERWKAMLGCNGEDIGDSLEEWLTWVHPEDQEAFRTKLQAHLEGSTPHFEVEHRMLHKTEGERWMLTRGLAVRDESGDAYRMAGSLTDITQRKIAEEQLLHDAFHDALSGLPNRALFLDRVGQSIARASRDKDRHFAVLSMDLDRFKIINDSLGHSAGDDILKEVGERLGSCLRPADTLARLGGDEFSILLEDIASIKEAVGFAKRVETILKTPLHLKGETLFVTASVGITAGSPEADSAEALLSDAETAMYKAKSQGGARYAVFDTAMRRRAIESFHMETDLRRAVEHEDFRVFYQPIISLKTGKTEGFEALARWLHPKKGLLSPSLFIGLAEETGLVVPIGMLVLKEACNQLKAWKSFFPKTLPLVVSVNLSGVQFLRPEIILQIDLLLREIGLQGSSLKLEITESVLIEHAQYAQDMLSQIKAQGISLCIDDFGTGYSSIGYLKRYPIDTVKIDKSFTSKIDSDPESYELVKTMVSMAHNLGKEVIVEGVESREQLTKVKALGCEFVQGFLFSKAVNGETAETLIARKWYW